MPNVKFAIKDVNMTKKSQKCLSYPHLASYNLQEDDLYRRISAIHESRNVRHTKKCRVTFRSAALLFYQFTRPILQVHEPTPLVTVKRNSDHTTDDLHP